MNMNLLPYARYYTPLVLFSKLCLQTCRYRLSSNCTFAGDLANESDRLFTILLNSYCCKYARPEGQLNVQFLLKRGRLNIFGLQWCWLLTESYKTLKFPLVFNGSNIHIENLSIHRRKHNIIYQLKFSSASHVHVRSPHSSQSLYLNKLRDKESFNISRCEVSLLRRWSHWDREAFSKRYEMFAQVFTHTRTLLENGNW